MEEEREGSKQSSDKIHGTKYRSFKYVKITKLIIRTKM